MEKQRIRTQGPAQQTTLNGPLNWHASHHSYLYAFAFKRVGDEELALDLVQDTFLAGLEKIHLFQGKSSERTWLTSILLNKVMDVYRRRQVESMVKPAQAASIATADSADKAYTGQEFYHSLNRFLVKMPHLWSSVFKLKYIEELDTKEICRKLCITPSNFWIITYRCRIQLRHHFSKEY